MDKSHKTRSLSQRWSAYLVLSSCQALEESSNSEIAKREKARLKEIQKLKKQKIQEILVAQNSAIDADMVSIFY